jgi:hypothetical protein
MKRNIHAVFTFLLITVVTLTSTVVVGCRKEPLSNNGPSLKVTQFGSTSDDLANALAADSSGNVYVAGFTVGTFPG